MIQSVAQREHSAIEQEARQVRWERTEVKSPHLERPISVVAAKDIPYVSGGNRLQILNIYLPSTSEMSALIGTPATSLPNPKSASRLLRYHVHIHGGAWRDPQLTSASIEPTVAHAFSAIDGSLPIIAIASINYRVSQFPTDPVRPYDVIKDKHSDPAREAVHPEHVSDVLNALDLLRHFGLTDQSYILSGHSCGACIAFQAILQPPGYFGLVNIPDAPCPAAVLGLNGLYDLPDLVHGLDACHEHLSDEYKKLLSNAFGSDESKWPSASPARFDPAEIADGVRDGSAPRLIVLDQSLDDQLVPINQKQKLEANLAEVPGLRVVAGHRCVGKHAAPWEQGSIIWDSLRDVLTLLKDTP